MNYYNVKDIMKITGLKISKCYQIIRDLNKSYKKDYPKTVLSKGVIPIFYFNECMGNVGKSSDVESSEK